MSERDEFGAFLIGFIIGGLTGAAVSLLLAPQSGLETRALIKEKAIEIGDKASETYEDTVARAEAAAAEARTRADEWAKIARERFGAKDDKCCRLRIAVRTPGQTITRQELDEYGSTYRILREKFHLIPTEADETLEVALASSREALLLQIKPRSPLLLSERTTYSQDRSVIEFVRILYRGDRYRYIAKLTR